MPTTVQGPAWITVTGTWVPSSAKIWVIPILRPISPSFFAMIRVLELDLDVDAGGQIQLHERVDGLGRGIDDVQETLVGAHLELLPGGLVHVRAAQDRPAIDDGGQEHGPGHAGARPPDRLHDLLHRAIEQVVIVGLEADANLLIGGHRGHRLVHALRDHSGPHRPPPLPHRKPQLLLHRNRRDQLPVNRHVVPRHHHLHPRRQRAHPRHVRRPKIKLRPIPPEKPRVPPPPPPPPPTPPPPQPPPPPSSPQPPHSPPPRPTSSLSTPRSNVPTLSPACPSSSNFRNISTPVTTVFRVG